MRTRSLLVLSVTCLLAVAVLFASRVSVASSSDSVLIDLLRSKQLKDRHAAVRQAASTSSRSDALNLALVQALNEALDYRQANLGNELGDEYYLDLVKVTSEWRDPRAIPTLALTVGDSADARAALAEWGDPAVDALHAVASVKTSQSTTSQIGGSLQTLEMMLSGRASRAVSAAHMAAIRKLAVSRLSKDQRPAVFAAAARVGIALRDSELISQFEKIVREPARLREYGITDQEEIDSVINSIRFALLQRNKT